MYFNSGAPDGIGNTVPRLVLNADDPAIHQIVDAISKVLQEHSGVVSVAHIYALREFRAALPARDDGPTLPGVA